MDMTDARAFRAQGSSQATMIQVEAGRPSACPRRTRQRMSSRGRVIFARRRRRPPLRTLAVSLAFAALALAGFQAIAAMGVPILNRFLPGPVIENGPVEGTPVSDWHAGELPFLYQTDPAWADLPYAGGTIEENGCGPTCLSMVYVGLTGHRDMGPVEMCAMSERDGHAIDGMTAWTLMTEGAAKLGLNSEEVPADATRVRSLLEAGTPIIASVRPGDFTTTGHFIVLAGVDESGDVTVRDPNSADRSAKPWDLDRVLSQANNLWAFSW